MCEVGKSLEQPKEKENTGSLLSHSQRGFCSVVASNSTVCLVLGAAISLDVHPVEPVWSKKQDGCIHLVLYLWELNASRSMAQLWGLAAGTSYHKSMGLLRLGPY